MNGWLEQLSTFVEEYRTWCGPGGPRRPAYNELDAACKEHDL